MSRRGSYLPYQALQEPPLSLSFPGTGPEAIEWFMPLSEPPHFLARPRLSTAIQQSIIQQLLAVFTGYGRVTLHAKHDEIIELHAKHNEIIELHGKLEKGAAN